MIAPFKSTRPLGEVAKVISGYAFKSAEFGGEGVPVIKNLFGVRFPSR
jgi:hypothetical protein